MVYKGVRGATQLLGKGAETLLASLAPLLEAADHGKPDTPQRDAALAVLNGVMGDRLVASHSPFAIPMSYRFQGQRLDPQAWPAGFVPTGKVLLLIHGLCMNEGGWRVEADGQVTDHGQALATQLGYTPVYLRYNSGLHTSQNGHELAAQLEDLLARWPSPVDELTVVAHSMGGLLIRSAFHDARQKNLRWPDQLKNIVFLGTPHHGAPLERAGNWVDAILGSTPYSAPFAKLGQLRSAGITDLRYGHVLDEDWQGHDRFHRNGDQRVAMSLPEGVACYAVAATTAAKRSALADRLFGDGLVPLHSALGQHDDPRRTLAFARDRQWIAYRMGHLQLLGSPAVTQQLLAWLTPPAA
jgi:pimeloyl-ACP methyl ester carboxylesterase